MISFPDYETPIGKEIRAFLSGNRRYPVELQHLLFAANRWEKAEEIKSRLRKNQIIIVDRYTESNLAYGTANGLDIDWLANLEKGLPRADVVIVLDAPAPSLGARRPQLRKDAYELSSDLQAKAHKAYRDMANERNWKVIDAKESIAHVQTRIIKTVKENLLADRGTRI